MEGKWYISRMRLAEAAAQLMTIPGAAAMIGIDAKTAHRQVRRGRLATVETADGKHLVTVAEAVRYRADQAGRPGRRPRA